MFDILLIGNGGGANSADGQTVKVNLYKKILCKEGLTFYFVDLYNYSHHFFSVLVKIIRNIKRCKRIVLMTAQKGSRFLIPLINYLNKRSKKPFIFPMIGINVLHKYIDSLNSEEHFKFIHNLDFQGIKPTKKDKKQLKEIDFILAENSIIKNVMQNFFHLNNVVVMQNFRDYAVIKESSKFNNNCLNMVFLSRITKEKGVLELIKAVNEINSSSPKKIIKLDIYGRKNLDCNGEFIFNSGLNNYVSYKGTIANNNVIKVISKYDIFAFPTLYKGEGTPGVFAESLISGVPILTSNFAQVEALVQRNFDSVIFDWNENDSLKQTILSLMDRDKIADLTANTKKSAKKYLYSYNRQDFLFYIAGIGSNK